MLPPSRHHDRVRYTAFLFVVVLNLQYLVVPTTLVLVTGIDHEDPATHTTTNSTTRSSQHIRGKPAVLPSTENRQQRGPNLQLIPRFFLFFFS